MAVETTTIQGKIIAPDGSFCKEGHLLVKLSEPGASASDGSIDHMLSEVQRFEIVDGVIKDQDGNPFALVPNDVITPSTTSYAFHFHLLKPAEHWIKDGITVDTAPDPVDIGDL